MASSNSTSSFTAVNDTDFSQLDLNGKIIIKAQFNDDIRRIPITNDEITYDELILMMQRLFKLQPSDEIHLKYRDDDDDLISIIDDNDLSFAIQYSRILKLRVLVNEKTSPSITVNHLKEISQELVQIRNRCNTLLEKLHLNGVDNKTGLSINQSSSLSGDTNEVQTQTEQGEKNEQKHQQKAYGQPPKELDPLNTSAASAPKLGSDEPGMQNQNSMDAKTSGSAPDANANGTSGNEKSEPEPGFSPIAQTPVLQQAYPAPPVRPPVPNNYPQSMPRSAAQQQQMPQAPPPPTGFHPPGSYFEPPKAPQMPPPTSTPGSYSSDSSSYSRMPVSGPNQVPMFRPPSSYQSGGPPQPPSSKSPNSRTSYEPWNTFTPSGAQAPPPPPPPSHLIQGPMMGYNQPPPPPPPTSMIGPMAQQQQQPPAPPKIGSMPPPMPHTGPMSPPQMQSPMQQMPPPPPQSNQPPSAQPVMSQQQPPPPPQPQQQQQQQPQQQQQQPPHLGPPPGGPMPPGPGMIGGIPPPPPTMSQFNLRGGGFSYGAHRPRYPATGM